MRLFVHAFPVTNGSCGWLKIACHWPLGAGTTAHQHTTGTLEKMVMWLSVPASTSRTFIAFLSLIVLTTSAIKPNDFVPVSTPFPALLQHIRHVSSSFLSLIGALIRQRYQRFTSGRLELEDMVQLIGLCSVVVLVRLWRRRSITSEGQSETSDAGQIGEKAAKSKKVTLWDFTRTAKPGSMTT